MSRASSRRRNTWRMPPGRANSAPGSTSRCPRASRRTRCPDLRASDAAADSLRGKALGLPDAGFQRLEIRPALRRRLLLHLPPVPAPAIAQPEHAAADVGRVVELDRRLAHLARMGHVLLGVVRMAHDARIELVDRVGVGAGAALADALGELRNALDPMIDRAARDLEALGELLVGRAQHAELAGEIGILGLVERGTSTGDHDS